MWKIKYSLMEGEEAGGSPAGGDAPPADPSSEASPLVNVDDTSGEHNEAPDVFGDLANEFDQEDIGEVAESEPAEAPAAKAPTVPPVPSAPAEETPPAEPPAGEVETPPTTPPKKEEPASEETPPKSEEEKPPESPPTAKEEEAKPPEKTEEELKAERETARASLKDSLVERYKLSEEDIETVRTEPEKVLPGMLAEAFMDVFEAVNQRMQTMLPRAIEQISAQQTQVQAAETAFYTANPALDKAKHGEVVQRLGHAYRQANPSANMETFNREVGAQAIIALKIPFDTRTGKVIEEPVETPPATPPAFKPAQESSAHSPKPAEENFWTGLSREMDEEDA